MSNIINPVRDFVQSAQRAKDYAMLTDKEAVNGFHRSKRCYECFMWFTTIWSKFNQKDGAYKAKCPLCKCEQNENYKKAVMENEGDYKDFHNRKVTEGMHLTEEKKRANEAAGVKVTGLKVCKRELI